jgi:hypothetical protein
MTKNVFITINVMFMCNLLFLFCHNVFSQEIILPEGTTEIKPFEYENKNLSEINIPNAVINIGEWAFSSNNLKKISLPYKIKSIGNMAFERNQLRTLIFPDSIKFIGSYAFYLNQLDSIILPKDAEIWTGAFQRNNLTTITIPEGPTWIGPYVFSDNAISNIFISNSVITVGYCAFANNNLSSIVLPQSVKRIFAGAFNNNPLTEITIGKKVVIDTPIVEGSKGMVTMGIYSKEFIKAYNTNNRRAGVYSYDINKKVWICRDIENVVDTKYIISQLLAGKFSAPFYGWLGFLITVILFYLSMRNQKSKLVYNYSREYIYAIKGEDNTHLEILWDNEPVENVRSIELVLWNNGKRAIRQCDISKDYPIVIECKNKNVKILNCSFSKISRKTINLEKTMLDDNKIQIVLSNDEAFEKNDGFEIVITYTCDYSAKDDWVVGGKVFDSHNIKYIGNSSVIRRLMTPLLFLGVLVIILAVGYAIDRYVHNFLWYSCGFMLLALFYVMYRFPLKKEYKTPKWN